MYIAWDEWNVWYRARGNKQRGRRILEERYNLEDALVVATFLNSFVNHAHIVKMANMAQLVNVIAPMFTNDQGMFLQTIYHPLELFAKNSKGKSLELFVDSPKYKTKRFDDVPYLDASAAWDNGIARDQRREPPSRPGDRGASSSARTRASPARSRCTEVNGPDIKAENDFGKTTVQPVRSRSTADGKKLRYTLPGALVHDAEGAARLTGDIANRRTRSATPMSDNRFSRRYFFYGTLLAGAVPRGGFGQTSLKAAGL